MSTASSIQNGNFLTQDIETLRDTAALIRSRIITTSHRSKTPHLASCLSCVDIMVALYFNIMRIDAGKPADPARDRFILSKGHGAPGLFQVLAERGFYPVSDLDTYGADGGIFAEHPPTPHHLPGIEAATGSLGHGLPMGLGMATAGRLKGLDFRVFVVLGDGECNEGSNWEAAMFAGARALDNVVVIVDYNKWQATGRSEEIMSLGPLVDKWHAFGWNACEADGHDMDGLVSILSEVPDGSGKPKAIIAHTIKGKGVSFMEDDNNWHYRIPNEEEVAAANRELGVPA
ncbi:MAG: transketolase [Pseudomonadota bacterium]